MVGLLHWASICGHTDIAKLLLEKGANVLALTSSNMNCLQKQSIYRGTDKGFLRMKNGKTAWNIVSAAKTL